MKFMKTNEQLDALAAEYDKGKMSDSEYLAAITSILAAA